MEADPNINIISFIFIYFLQGLLVYIVSQLPF